VAMSTAVGEFLGLPMRQRLDAMTLFCALVKPPTSRVVHSGWALRIPNACVTGVIFQFATACHKILGTL
jgi:hypothetical protein